MSTLPRALVFGPASRQGLGYKHLYMEQGIEHIARLQRFTQDSKNMTGELTRANLQELKMCLGLKIRKRKLFFL